MINIILHKKNSLQRYLVLKDSIKHLKAYFIIQ
jgi:hypothetical protein